MISNNSHFSIHTSPHPSASSLLSPPRPSSPLHFTTSPLLPWREISEELISGGMESRNSQRSWMREIGAGASFIGQVLTEGWQWVEANHWLTTDRDNKVSVWAEERESDRQAGEVKRDGFYGAVLWPMQNVQSQPLSQVSIVPAKVFLVYHPIWRCVTKVWVEVAGSHSSS